MGQQLDLFSRLPAPAIGLSAGATGDTPSLSSPAPEQAPPLVLAGQMGLFDFRSVALAEARSAVAAGALDEACVVLDALIPRCPGDAAVAREAADARALRERLGRIDAQGTRQRARALLAFARDLEAADGPLASLRRRLLARVAAEVRRQHGDAGELEGRLVGEYLLDAGEVDEAEGSLAAAAAILRAARPIFRLADIAFLREDRAAARRRYLHALLVDPFDPALATVLDEDVRALPGVVRDDLEIEDEPEAWAAPAGILMAVLPRPQDGEGPVFEGDAGAAPQRRAALAQARAFVEAIVAAGHAKGDAAIEVRRRMKKISPALFALYMDRVVRSAKS